MPSRTACWRGRRCSRGKTGRSIPATARRCSRNCIRTACRKRRWPSGSSVSPGGCAGPAGTRTRSLRRSTTGTPPSRRRRSACPDLGASIAGDPVLGRMLLADFSGDRVLERVLLYERRIESSLGRARADLRQLRRQPRPAAPGGATPCDQRWEESGGHSHASPVARADLARETSDPARENPGCETKPIGAGIGLVPREEPMRQGPPRVDEVGRGRPTSDQVEGRLYEETPPGVSARTSASPSCETKPIAPERHERQVLG